MNETPPCTKCGYRHSEGIACGVDARYDGRTTPKGAKLTWRQLLVAILVLPKDMLDKHVTAVRILPNGEVYCEDICDNLFLSELMEDNPAHAEMLAEAFDGEEDAPLLLLPAQEE